MTAPTVEQIAEVLDRHRNCRWSGSSYSPGWSCGAQGVESGPSRHQAEQVAALGVGAGEVEVEWRVETDQTKDDFDSNEREAREWLARCKRNPDWLPARLMRRTVTTTVGPWVEVTDEGGEGA